MSSPPAGGSVFLREPFGVDQGKVTSLQRLLLPLLIDQDDTALDHIDHVNLKLVHQQCLTNRLDKEIMAGRIIARELMYDIFQ